MTSTYVNDLRLNEMATGDQSGAWGTVTNLNLEMIAEAFAYGTEAIANALTHTITVPDGAKGDERRFYLKCTGGGQACTVTLAPNTVSKVWMIENATSYTLTFTQGSGANVAVLAGQVKMIATDGAGSGAVIYDLLTDVNLAGTTVMSAATIDDVAIDGKVITMTGSSGDTATITVAADGVLAIATTDAAAAAANISITADGTFTATGTTITLDSAGAIILDADGTFTATGTTITLDSAGDIILDAAGDEVIFKDGSANIGHVSMDSDNLTIKSLVSDQDIILQGNDGGSGITALTLDMSEAGAATFNSTVTRDLTRGSIDVGNSSGVSAPLAAGGADTVLTSDGTDISWAAAASGYRTLISTTTISNDATVLVEGLDNTYDRYQFVITDLLNAHTSNYACYMRFKSGGSIDTTAGNYRFANIKADSSVSGVSSKSSFTSSTSIDLITAMEDAAPDAGLITFDIFDPAGTTNSTKGFGTAVSPISTKMYTMHHAFTYEPAAAVTGVQFYAAIGNLASGTIKLYGIT